MHQIFSHNPTSIQVSCALQNWKTIINLVQTDPYAKAMTIFDIINEPDGRGLGWDRITPIYETIAAYAYSKNTGDPSFNSRNRGAFSLQGQKLSTQDYCSAFKLNALFNTPSACTPP